MTKQQVRQIADECGYDANGKAECASVRIGTKYIRISYNRSCMSLQRCCTSEAAVRDWLERAKRMCR